MKHKLLAVAAVIVGIGVTGFYAFDRWPRSADVQVLGKATLVPEIMSAGKDSPLTAPAVPAPPVATAAPPRASPGLYPREAEYRSLMASADPHANAKGYGLAWDCANEAENLRMNDRVPGAAPVAPKCGLAPGSWQDAELRKKGAVAAAKLGLPNGWAHLYLEEGPNGRLGAFTEADRAEWQQLAVETYATALAKVDSAALGYEAVVQEAAGNYARAAELYVASAAALARRTNQPYRQPEESLAEIRSKLSAADLNKAIADGRKLAETAKPGELL